MKLSKVSSILKKRSSQTRTAIITAGMTVMAAPAMAQLPTPSTPTDGAAAGNFRQFMANTGRDWVEVGAQFLLTVIAIGVVAAIGWKFFEWRRDRAELTDVAKIAGGGAAILAVGGFLLTPAIDYIAAI